MVFLLNLLQILFIRRFFIYTDRSNAVISSTTQDDSTTEFHSTQDTTITLSAESFIAPLETTTSTATSYPTGASTTEALSSAESTTIYHSTTTGSSSSAQSTPSDYSTSAMSALLSQMTDKSTTTDVTTLTTTFHSSEEIATTTSISHMTESSQSGTSTSPNAQTTTNEICSVTGILSIDGTCNCYNNTSEEGLGERLEEIKSTLEIEKKSLSSFQRQKISAADDRVSAAATGFVGVLVLVLVFVFISAADIYAVGQTFFKLIL